MNQCKLGHRAERVLISSLLPADLSWASQCTYCTNDLPNVFAGPFWPTVKWIEVRRRDLQGKGIQETIYKD